MVAATFPRGQSEADHSPQLVAWLRMSGVIFPLPHTPWQCGPTLRTVTNLPLFLPL